MHTFLEKVELGGEDVCGQPLRVRNGTLAVVQCLSLICSVPCNLSGPEVGLLGNLLLGRRRRTRSGTILAILVLAMTTRLEILGSMTKTARAAGQAQPKRRVVACDQRGFMSSAWRLFWRALPHAEKADVGACVGADVSSGTLHHPSVPVRLHAARSQ